MKKNWSNTELVAYALLPKIVKELDLGIQSRVKSSYQSKHLKMGVSNEQLIGEIIELTDEKRKNRQPQVHRWQSIETDER